MEFENWWLIGLPIFFGFGWIAARLDLGHLVRESRELPKSYFRGLNFLLNEQPDKAIEAFVEVVRIDRETLELHFALGSLFRRRGETERAIRMHKSLLDRGDIDESQRLQALFELGQDYVKAGLLDRAEDVFMRLRESRYRSEALRYLLEIYQQEKDWGRAIDMAGELEKQGDSSQSELIAHFHCELAGEFAARGEEENTRRQLDLAMAVNPGGVRAELMLGELHFSKGRHLEAIAAWERIGAQVPEYLALCGARLIESYAALGREKAGADRILDYLAKEPSIDLLDVAVDAVLRIHGADQAHTLLKHHLRKLPTLRGLDKLMEVQLREAEGDRRQDLELIRGLIHGHVVRLARYQCDNCGFRAKRFYWHCPACAKWDSYLPSRREEPGGMQ